MDAERGAVRVEFGDLIGVEIFWRVCEGVGRVRGEGDCGVCWGDLYARVCLDQPGLERRRRVELL